RNAWSDQLDQAEVEDLHLAVAGDEDVLRLEVAVNDPFVMRRAEAARDLHGVIGRLARRDRALPQADAQRLAFQQLADEEVLIVLGADVEDGDDVRMVEHPRRARFLFESAQRLGVVGEIAREDFDRHFAPQPGVDGAIHLAHPPRADLRGNAVWTELRAGNEHRRPKDSSYRSPV